ncbi:MAG: hypothetical protein EDR02_14360 [Actinobacteria bacterium]|nr:MAG: hypothetical protein EDR02_14360 [Actinomycetota bacterium]RIK04033.1 MAG: hypothetical protein DCC48_15135 [Acidobacteriota bacterium]
MLVAVLSVLSELTQPSMDALEVLRDASQFQWFTVTLLVLVIYVYAVEVERRNWDAVLAGLALWLMDWINEILNSAILHATDRSALWTVTGHTSYLILVGLTIEISMMFLIMGIVFVKMLPGDRELRLAGIPNRWIFVLLFSCLAVFIEELLVHTGWFHWEYWFWNKWNPLLIVIFGYATFFAVAAWVYDMQSRARQLRVVGSLAAVVVVLLATFGLAGWL